MNEETCAEFCLTAVVGDYLSTAFKLANDRILSCDSIFNRVVFLI